MAISSLQNPKFQSRLNNGEVNDSGYIYVLEDILVDHETASNQVTVWSDKAKTVELSQPIQLDADGTKEIWFDGTVDIRVEDSANTLLDTITGVESSPTISVSGEFNLVTNGSFENDSNGDGTPDGWSLSPLTDATISIDSGADDQSHGTQSLHFDSSGGTAGGGAALSDLFAVERLAGLTVTWSFKQADAADGSYKVDVLYYDENGDYVGVDNVWDYTAGAAPTTWTQYSNEDASPVVDANATQARIQLTGLGATGTDKIGECWFDNVSCIDPSGLVTLTGTQTLTNKTLTTPTITNPTVTTGTLELPSIIDSEADNLLTFGETATAVNALKITNAATGNAPQIEVDGETNVNLNIDGAGTGYVTTNGERVHGLVILDEALSLDATPATGSWTTQATGHTNAVAAIIRIYGSITDNSTATYCTVSARKTGGTGASAEIASGNETNNTAKSHTLNFAGEATVALDSSGQFDYIIQMTGSSPSLASGKVVLVGYYV